MRDVLSELDRWLEAGEEIALATLVETEGASPRAPGARFACTRTGRMIGSVSGGCVEADVVTRAMQVLDERRPVVQRYGIDDGLSVAVGLSCGGQIDVLIEPFDAEAAWRAAREALAADRAFALAVPIAPATLLGRRLGLSAQGPVAGGIDPALDDAVSARVEDLHRDGGQRVIELAYGDGTARLFVEVLVPPPRLAIVGATHIAMPLCRMATTLGFEVRVIDPRTPFATAERFPDAHAIVREWPDEAFDRTPIDARTHVVSLSHDLKFDIPTLARAVRSEARYVGALGSRRTHARRLEALRERGLTEDELARIHTPIGLDLGARSPEEIALAILAEIVATRHGRDAGPLRERVGPIHAATDARDA